MGQTKFVTYLRSFPMPAKTLELVLGEMKQLGVENETTTAYRRMLKDLEPDTIVTVRYVGATTVSIVILLQLYPR